MKIIRDTSESRAVSIVIGEYDICGRSFTGVQKRSAARYLNIEFGKTIIAGLSVNSVGDE